MPEIKTGPEIREVVSAYRAVDSHGHLGFYRVFHTPDSGWEALVRALDRSGVDKICLSALLALDVDYRRGNDLVGEAVRLSGGRILGHACVNPYEQGEVEKELDRCFQTLGMSAIKLHPSLQKCPEDSALYEPVYAYANYHKLVVMNHSWGSAANLRRIAARYPDMKLIAAHLGSRWDGIHPHPVAEAIRELDNVWVDTAGSGCHMGAFRRVYEYFGADKLIFGTDVPFLDIGYQIGNIVFSDIPEDGKRKVLRDNFMKLLGEPRKGR